MKLYECIWLVAVFFLLLGVATCTSTGSPSSESDVLKLKSGNNPEKSLFSKDLQEKITILKDVVLQHKKSTKFPLLTNFTLVFIGNIGLDLDRIEAQSDFPNFQDNLRVINARIQIAGIATQSLTNPKKEQFAKKSEALFERIKKNEEEMQKVRTDSIESLPEDRWLVKIGITSVGIFCDRLRQIARQTAFGGGLGAATTKIIEAESILKKLKISLEKEKNTLN